VSNDSELPEPFALKPLFQALGLCGFLPHMERFDKENGVTHHVLSLLTIGLLVVMEQKGQFPRGQRRLGKIL
jgi:hypothetical protein